MRERRALALGTALLVASAGGAAAGACGPNGLALPGTGGCVTLGGVVRAEATARPAPRLVPASPDGGARGAAARTGARVTLDASVPTAAGPLRAYLAAGTGSLSRR